MVKKTIIIIICAAVAAGVFIALANVLPFASMNPAKTGRIADTGIIAVNNGMCNVFLVESSDGYALIDAGVGMSALEKSLAETGVSPSEVRHVFLTHSDGDHVAALPLFTDATIYMSEDEAQMIDGRTKRSGNSGNSLPSGIDQGGLVLLGDGQALTVGGRAIRCVKAPGHTPGTMIYIVDDRYLFSGDAFKIEGGVMDVHPFTMDEELSKATMQRLHGDITRTELTLTSHFGYFESPALTLYK